MLSDLLSSSVEWYKETRVLTYYMNGFTVNIHTLSKNQLQLSTYHRLSVRSKQGEGSSQRTARFSYTFGVTF